jgi:acyl dehydratase
MTGLSSLRVGTKIPVWQREGTLNHWNRFAAANYEFAGHHMDDEVGRYEGFPGAFIMAPFSHAYLHCMLREWIGDEGDTRIVKVDMRLKNPLFRGRTMTAGGEVTALREEGGELFIDLGIWQVDDEGTQLGKGVATVAVPHEPGLAGSEVADALGIGVNLGIG